MAEAPAVERPTDGDGLAAMQARIVSAMAQRPFEPLREALRAYLSCADQLDAHNQVRRQVDASLALQERLRHFGDPAAGRLAICHAERAIRLIDPAWTAEDRIEVLDTAGNAYYTYGWINMRSKRFVQAVLHFGEALALIDPAAKPANWCLVANSLASVHATRHRIDGATHRDAAITVYRRVRSVAARHKLRTVWVDAATNILRMKGDEAEARDDTVELEKLSRRMRRIVRVLAADTPLITCTNTRLHFAITLQRIADRRYDPALLDEARRLLKQNTTALRKLGSDLEWAKSENSLAVIEMTIGEKQTDLKAYQRAARRLTSIAEFPSERQPRPRRIRPWTPEKVPEFYLDALINIASVRENISQLTGAVLPIQQNLDDLADYRQRQAPTDRALVAQLSYLEARNAIKMAALTHHPLRVQDAERLSLTAAAAFLTISGESQAAMILAHLADMMLEEVREPGIIDALRGAEVHLDRALELTDETGMSELHISIWRLYQSVRLRRAGWQGDCNAARSILHEVRTQRWPAGTVVTALLGMFMRRLEIDALSVIARITNKPSDYDQLLTAIQAYSSTDQDVVFALRLAMAEGHALRTQGDSDRAIEVWTTGQERLWDAMIGTGSAGLARVVTCVPGAAGHDLMAGRGLSLADELAFALLERNAPGDVARALTAVERGRAMAAALNRGAGPAAYTLRNELRRLHKRHADHIARLEPGRVLQAGTGSRIERRREQLQRELTAMVGQNGNKPVADTASLIRALPQGAGVLMVVTAESGGALIAIGAGLAERGAASFIVLDQLTRAWLDSLLAGPGGFLQAVEDIRSAASTGMAECLARQIARFSAKLHDVGVLLQDRLIEPCRTLLDRHFGCDLRRLTWIVPGTMWSLPLHAIDGSDGRVLAEVQGFGHSLAEVTRLALQIREPQSLPRAALVVDNPTDDIVLPTSTKTILLPDQYRAVWLRKRRATVPAVLRALRGSRLFIFNGHGQVVPGLPESSGLWLAGRRVSGPPGKVEHELLTFDAVRRLDLQQRDLAVLAACDVGSTEVDVNVDDFHGLASELLSAGFSMVVAATWPVEASATAAILRDFLSVLQAEPFDPGAALSAAQQALRSNPAFSPMWQARGVGASAEPDAQISVAGDGLYWWAGFRLIGCA